MVPQTNVTLDFTNPALYEPNSEITIDGGGAQLIPIYNLQSDWLCGARFDSFVNLNWGNGILAGTPYGGAGITNGKLDLTGNTKRLDFAAGGNANGDQRGSVKFMFTPAYSGSPSVIEVFFNITQDPSV